MSSIAQTARHSVSTLALALVLCGTAAPGAAGPLIKFTDPNGGVFAGALSDDDSNLAVSWTQSVASSNVTLSAVLSSNVGPTTGRWYVSNAIGAGTTSANVVSSGIYSLTGALLPGEIDDFDLAPRVVLGSGLSFAPGTYFLVLDGPAGNFSTNASWVGDGFAESTLAPGFSLGDYFLSSSVDSFAPSGTFVSFGGPPPFVFELDGDAAVIPLPASLPLMTAGVALFGLLGRRAWRPAAQPSNPLP